MEIVGPIALGAVLVYAIFRNRTRSAATKQMTDRETVRVQNAEEQTRRQQGEV